MTVVTAFVPRRYARQHGAQQLGVHDGERLDSRRKLVALHVAVAGNQDHAIGHSAQDGCIADRQQRRRIDDDEIEALAELVEQAGHGFRPQKLSRVGWGRSSREDGDLLAMPWDQSFVESVGTRCDVGETQRPVQAQIVRRPRATKVAFHETDLHIGLSHRCGDVAGRDGFALVGDGRTDDNLARRTIDVDELQVGTDGAEVLDSGSLLVHGDEWPGLEFRVVANRPQRAGATEATQIVGRANRGVELLSYDGERNAESQSDERTQRDVEDRLGRARTSGPQRRHVETGGNERSRQRLPAARTVRAIYIGGKTLGHRISDLLSQLGLARGRLNLEVEAATRNAGADLLVELVHGQPEGELLDHRFQHVRAIHQWWQRLHGALHRCRPLLGRGCLRDHSSRGFGLVAGTHEHSQTDRGEHADHGHCHYGEPALSKHLAVVLQAHLRSSPSRGRLASPVGCGDQDREPTEWPPISVGETRRCCRMKAGTATFVGNEPAPVSPPTRRCDFISRV